MEYKFRYVFKHMKDFDIQCEIFTLDQIQAGKAQEYIFALKKDRYELIGRDEYTGLPDKNGKEIYEGDIVRYGDTIHKVVFEQRNNTAYFGLVYSPLETRPFGHYQDLRQIEVIGSHWDNPELLKEVESV